MRMTEKEAAFQTEEGRNTRPQCSDVGPGWLMPGLQSRAAVVSSLKLCHPVTSLSSPMGEGNDGLHLTGLLRGEAELRSTQHMG